MNSYALGWSEVWDRHLEQHNIEKTNNPARIVARHKSVFPAITAAGERLNLYVSGKDRHGFSSTVLAPVVGDWCSIGERFIDESNEKAAFIETLFPRKTSIVRSAAGLTSDEQILVANIDILFIVTSVNRDLNINRLRRYLLLAAQGGPKPIICLSKMDLLDSDCLFALNAIEQTFPDVQCIYTSTVSGAGIEELHSILKEGTTAVFLGSSGVGKSTLINAIMNRPVQETGAIRAVDQRGRHTTSGSELFLAPNGGLIIDTAGLRQVGVVGDEEALDRLMPTVSELGENCRFADCSHSSEPGCAVLSALSTGLLEESDWNAYTQLSRELAYARRKGNQRLEAEERKKWKQRTMNYRRSSKSRD